ncbi:hypothetical protein [Psittacicella gerlachiana]|uniref:Uncharacterized protein n=1 Tax=Psittacicella gerlachiana TaxID=2028574 RepID=A0A3A1YCH2_9GAMM|nr:hypothetical protein [Psittacicella gerlachiana]RIY33914.1 hypothetical protein CKF59_06010 [Psittacicella gerlachiana]
MFESFKKYLKFFKLRDTETLAKPNYDLNTQEPALLKQSRDYHIKKIVVTLAASEKVASLSPYLYQAKVSTSVGNKFDVHKDNASTISLLRTEYNYEQQLGFNEYEVEANKLSYLSQELEDKTNENKVKDDKVQESQIKVDLSTRVREVNNQPSVNFYSEVDSNVLNDDKLQSIEELGLFFHQYLYSLIEINIKDRKYNLERSTISEQALASSILANSFTIDQTKSLKDLDYLASVTVSSNYNGNDYTLSDIEHNLADYVSLINLDRIHLDLQAQRVKSICIDVLKREFKNISATRLNTLLVNLFYRDLQGSQYIGEQSVFLRLVVEELNFSKLHFVALKNPCVYNLNEGLKARFIFILLVSPEEVELVNRSLQTLIKKAQEYSCNLLKFGIPTDVEEVWKDLANLDWKFKISKNNS